ncbi:MAG: class I SAM-dependent methyltransferase [Myxococcota bacterium]
MSGDPLALLADARVRGVLERLYTEAQQQLPRLLLHYLPHVPKLLMGRALSFPEESITGFYADKSLPLEPGQAAFIYLTARALRAELIVEFGTSFGISTLWLAAAVRAKGRGRVIATELVPEKAARAQAHFEEAGLAEWIELRVGDARETLLEVPDGIDLFLNDGFAPLALELLQRLAPHMREGGMVVTDNVGTFPGNYRDYLAYLDDASNGFEATVPPYKSGTSYAVRLA